MSKYRIQACSERMWYVENYLVPSLLEQKIDEKDIHIHLDIDHVGNLESCMQSFKDTIGEQNEITWYLQDDVVICPDFKERTEIQYNTVVLAFCSNYNNLKNLQLGRTNTRNMWYSFPCVGIPNWIANKCADWYYRYASKSTSYSSYVKSGKMDDSIFWIFMQDFSGVKEVINLVPNLVDHIDYLLGGSVANPERDRKIIRSSYWDWPEVVEELERKLKYEKSCMLHSNKESI